MLPSRGKGRAQDYGGQPWARKIARTPEQPRGEREAVSRCVDVIRSWPIYLKIVRSIK